MHGLGNSAPMIAAGLAGGPGSAATVAEIQGLTNGMRASDLPISPDREYPALMSNDEPARQAGEAGMSILGPLGLARLGKNQLGMFGDTANHLRIAKEGGGSPTVPIPGLNRPSIKGGVFDQEPIRSLEGTPADIEASTRSTAEGIARKHQAEHGGIENAWKTQTEALRGTPHGQEPVDITPLVLQADKLITSMRTPKAARSYARTFISDLDRFQTKNGQYMMSRADLNDFRTALRADAKANVPTGSPADADVMQLYSGAKVLLYNSERGVAKTMAPALFSGGAKPMAPEVTPPLGPYEAINSKFGDDIQQILNEQGTLGLAKIALDPEEARGRIAQPTEANIDRMAMRLGRQGQITRVAGRQRAATARAPQMMPEFSEEMKLPERLAAKQGLSFGIGEVGYGPFAYHRLLMSNTEPLAGRVAIPALDLAGKAGYGGAAGLLGRARIGAEKKGKK